MDTSVRKKIVLLFDTYSEDSKKLQKSFEMAGIDCDVVVIDDDGYLPDGIVSVYSSYLDEFSMYDTYLGKARYFNQIAVPDYWEIEASSVGGHIHDLDKKRAKIYFAETNNNKRRVKIVEWYDDNGKVRLSEHYNKCGVMYARTSFNAKGEKVNKIYYSSKMQEIIYENFVTGAIVLNYKGEEMLFSSKIEFIVHFMRSFGYENYRIYYNSLWYSFFVSQQLKQFDGEKEDVLFWQENERDDIPGNMNIIFNGEATRTRFIMVQRKAAYERLIALGAPKSILRMKGFIYPFERENGYRKKALIATNSDQIEHIEDIVRELPEVEFSIAAITTMSDKLLALGKYENVFLYPNIKNTVFDELFDESDFYFDINHYDVICDSVYRAFINNQLILSFDNTRHSKAYIDDENVYAADEWAKMVADVRGLLNESAEIDKRLKLQRERALSENDNSYMIFS